MGATSHHVDSTPSLPLDAGRSGVSLSHPRSPQPPRETVYLIHEDGGFCHTLSTMLASCEMAVFSFSSCADCLERGQLREAGCLVLDLHLHHSDGAGLHEWICPELYPPLVITIDHSDVPAAVRAMKMGAVDVFIKPLDPVLVVEAVHLALVRNRKLQQKKAELEHLQARHSLLTPREQEVVPFIVGGLLNKQAASVLGISPGTLQRHRGQVMRKMEADSLADLVRMAVKLRIPYWREG